LDFRHLPTLIDSQWHLDFPELDGVLAGARAVGVGLMLTISTKVRHFAAPGHPYASSVLMDLPS
jgi:hypothetical protein